MNLYADLRSDLLELFSEEPFLPATITRKAGGVYDPASRTTSGATTVSISCRAFPDDVSTTDALGVRTSFTTIMANVAMIEGDVISIAGTSYTATSVSGNPLTGIYEATVTR